MTLRLAASSLGLPDADLDEIIAVAQAGGCTGLELRAAEGQAVHTGLDATERDRVRSRLADAGMTLLAVCSYIKLCADTDDAMVVTAIEQHVDLAADLGAAGVRLFPGGTGDGSDDDRGVRRLVATASGAWARDVRLLVETHDSHPRGADVARLLDQLPSNDGVGIIWDFVHTWRSAELPAATYDAIAPWLGYVQLKDATPPVERPVPALIGAGEVPLDEIRAVLDRHGYAGWWSVEWEKAWWPEIPPLSEALASARAWAGATMAE